MWRAAESAAMSPSAQVIVRVDALNVTVQAPPSVHFADPATYVVFAGSTSVTTTSVWSRSPADAASNEYVSVAPYAALALSTCFTSVSAPVGTWWSVVDVWSPSVATLVCVDPRGASASTVTEYFSTVVPGPPSPAAGTSTDHTMCAASALCGAGLIEPSTTVTLAGSVSVTVCAVAAARPVLVSVTV